MSIRQVPVGFNDTLVILTGDDIPDSAVDGDKEGLTFIRIGNPGYGGMGNIVPDGLKASVLIDPDTLSILIEALSDTFNSFSE